MASLVTGYHGTSRTNADEILRRGFSPSANTDDWLGTGVYFFQDAPLMAQAWARQRFGDAIVVLAAEIDLAGCMDLVDLGWRHALRRAYTEVMNEPGHLRNHSLDARIVNVACVELESRGRAITSVRSVFASGDPMYPGSALAEFGHIQIAVRNGGIIGPVREWS